METKQYWNKKKCQRQIETENDSRRQFEINCQHIRHVPTLTLSSYTTELNIIIRMSEWNCLPFCRLILTSGLNYLTGAKKDSIVFKLNKNIY